MFCKAPYTIIGGKHRPYLEVVFNNKKNNKNSSKTFALVDSGADHTVIPFSLGTSIGLQKPTEEEKLASVGGVGGNLSYIERECNLYMVNRLKNEIYVFKETVWWIYPDDSTQKRQAELLESYKSLSGLKSQCYSGTELHTHFENQMKGVMREIIDINNKLDTSVLLGRPFFDNFDFIQFCHKDREMEEKCFFNYKVTKGKPVEIIPLQSTPLLNTVKTRG